MPGDSLPEVARKAVCDVVGRAIRWQEEMLLLARQIADASGRVIGAFEDFALFKKSLKQIGRRIEDRDLVYKPNSYLLPNGDRRRLRAVLQIAS
jgi:hypothetical protein